MDANNKTPENDLSPEQLVTNGFTKTSVLDILTIITGLIVLFGLAAMVFILPDKTFSEQENRVLKQFPEFSFKKLREGSFISEMSKYYSDQFPFRDNFVGLKGMTEIGFLKGENNGVILGKDGYLITKDSRLTVDSAIAQMVTNINRLTEFAAAMNEMKIPVTLAGAGRSIDALISYAPGAYPKDNSARLCSSFNGLAGGAQNIKSVDLISPLKILIERRDRGQLYYKTDHHWTTLGAYYAYAEIIKSFKEEGLEPLALGDFEIVEAADDFYGTTWSKAGMKWIAPDTIYFFRYAGDEDFITTIRDTGKSFNGFYDFSYLEQKDKYSSFISGNNARVDITKPGEPGRPKMLLIKDSFAHSVAPFLAYHYDLIILDLRYYLDSVAEVVYREGVDRILILQNIQNFSEDDTYGILKYGVDSVLNDFVRSQYPVRGIFINGNPIEDYVIIYPSEENERRQKYHKDAAQTLCDIISARAGIELQIAEPGADASGFDKVILLTNEGLPADNNLIKISTEGNDLVFRCNIGEDWSGYAVRRFIDRYIKNASGSFNFGEDFILSDIGEDVIMITPKRDQ